MPLQCKHGTGYGLTMSKGHAGRAGLVHLGEHECSEWVLQQRMSRTRSQMLPPQQRSTPGLPPLGKSHLGGNLQRQGSVLVPPASCIAPLCCLLRLGAECPQQIAWYHPAAD